MRLYLRIIALAVALCTWAATLEWNQHGDVMHPPLPREVLWQVYASATTMPVEDADAEEDAVSHLSRARRKRPGARRPRRHLQLSHRRRLTYRRNRGRTAPMRGHGRGGRFFPSPGTPGEGRVRVRRGCCSS